MKQHTEVNHVPTGKTDVCARESDSSQVFVPNFRLSAPSIYTPCTRDGVIIEPQQVEPGGEDRASSSLLAQLKEPRLCAHSPHKSHRPSVQGKNHLITPFKAIIA